MLDQFNHPYILLFLSMAFGAMNSCSSKYYSQRFTNNAADSAFYTLITSLVTSTLLLLFILIEGFKGISPFTLILAIAFGIVTSLRSTLYIKTLSIGPLAFTSIINSSCSIIPACYGLFLGQMITIWQLIGIAFMIASLFFIVEKDGEERKTSLKWLFFTLLCFFMGGLIGILQSTHQTSTFRFQINEFLLITFLMAVVVSIVDLFRLKCKGIQKTKDHAGDHRYWFVLLLGGISCAFINIVNLYLSGIFPNAFFFPVINGGTLVVTVVASLTFFHEKMTPRRWVGMALGTVSLLFLMGIVQAILSALGLNV